MPLTQREIELRQQARELIGRGELPCVPPGRLWAGFGAGEACSLCKQPIEGGDTQYEIEVGGPDPGLVSYFFHFICHGAWQLECAHAQAREQQSASLEGSRAR